MHGHSRYQHQQRYLTIMNYKGGKVIYKMYIKPLAYSENYRDEKIVADDTQPFIKIAQRKIAAQVIHKDLVH